MMREAMTNSQPRISLRAPNNARSLPRRKGLSNSKLEVRIATYSSRSLIHAQCIYALRLTIRGREFHGRSRTISAHHTYHPLSERVGLEVESIS